MVASSDQNESGAADKSAELGRLAAEMLLKSPLLAMNPMLVPPTAALAAAAIVGFGLSTQMTGAFLGALQGAMDVANRFAAEQDAEAKAAEAAHADGAAPVAEAEPVNGTASIFVPDPVVVTAPVAKSKRDNKRAVAVDDLKRISGIGPKLEQLLNGLGIRAVADIAVWSEDDVKRIDAALGVDGRIARDDWVGQAKKLVAKAAA